MCLTKEKKIMNSTYCFVQDLVNKKISYQLLSDLYNNSLFPYPKHLLLILFNLGVDLLCSKNNNLIEETLNLFSAI